MSVAILILLSFYHEQFRIIALSYYFSLLRTTYSRFVLLVILSLESLRWHEPHLHLCFYTVSLSDICLLVCMYLYGVLLYNHA